MMGLTVAKLVTSDISRVKFSLINCDIVRFSLVLRAARTGRMPVAFVRRDSMKLAISSQLSRK